MHFFFQQLYVFHVYNYAALTVDRRFPVQFYTCDSVLCSVSGENKKT